VGRAGHEMRLALNYVHRPIDIEDIIIERNNDTEGVFLDIHGEDHLIGRR